MALDLDKILADVKAAAQPDLEQRAKELREQFLSSILDIVDSTNIDKLDDLLRKAASYEIRAVLSTDRAEAEQYATAAEEVLRQVKLTVIAERIATSREVAAMIEAAALTVWGGFKSVASGVLNVAVKAVINSVVPGGGAIADAASGFLGEAIDGLTGTSDNGGSD